MKIYVPYDYDCYYSLNNKQSENTYGPVDITEDEFFAFKKCEIEYLAWQEKISEMLKK